MFLAGAFPAASLDDPLGRPLPPTLHLAYPPLYIVLAPLFTLWDGVSMLSMTRLQGFLVGVVVLYLAWRLVHASWGGARRSRDPTRGSRAWRELRVFLLSLGALVLFVMAGLLWHRPMAALAGVPPGEVVFDTHSHTNVSHDVRGTLMRGFDTEANLRWHARGGFDVVFVTDHNTVAGLRSSAAARPRAAPPSHFPVACPGIEVSAWKAHIVLLGDSLPVDPRRYNNSLQALERLLGESERAYGALTVLSLPEYERNHRDRLDTLFAAGADGVEIVNAAPKANEISRARRDSVVALARRDNRFVVGASDSHGWGATNMVWNLMAVPTPHPEGPALCDAVLQGLRRGFGSSQVLERRRLRPGDGWPAWLTPEGVLWEAWRSMGWTLTASWLAWVWLLWGVFRRRYT
ncbi:MAG: PHP domain-containing protein [Gemmatimonadales bacterium]